MIETAYLQKPHNTHLKQKLFGEEYNYIFSRKINAEKIYLANLIYKVIEDNSTLLDSEQIRSYGLSIFFFTYVFSEIMREDVIGKAILENPREYITTEKEILINTLKKSWELITPDINADIEEYTDEHNGFFDYKNVFKNAQFVKTLSRKIKSDYTRLTRRNINDSFSKIYESYIPQTESKAS